MCDIFLFVMVLLMGRLWTSPLIITFIPVIITDAALFTFSKESLPSSLALQLNEMALTMVKCTGTLWFCLFWFSLKVHIYFQSITWCAVALLRDIMEHSEASRLLLSTTFLRGGETVLLLVVLERIGWVGSCGGVCLHHHFSKSTHLSWPRHLACNNVPDFKGRLSNQVLFLAW